MHRSLISLAGLGSAIALSAPASAGPVSAHPAAPFSVNSGNGHSGGTEIEREQHQQEAQAPSGKQEEANEKTIQMSEVPKAALDAAEKELGTAPTEAKVVNGSNPMQYELEARDKTGKEIAVHVLANGTLVKNE